MAVAKKTPARKPSKPLPKKPPRQTRQAGQTREGRKGRQTRKKSRHPQGLQVRLQAVRHGRFRGGGLRLCRSMDLLCCEHPDEEKEAVRSKNNGRPFLSLRLTLHRFFSAKRRRRIVFLFPEMPYTPFNRMVDALARRPRDHVPVLPLLAGWAGAQFSSIPPARIAGDARRIAEVQIKAQEALGFDGLFGYLDPLYIPEAFGCPVQFTPAGPLVRPLKQPA